MNKNNSSEIMRDRANINIIIYILTKYNTEV